jgi:hypothetical protein
MVQLAVRFSRYSSNTAHLSTLPGLVVVVLLRVPLLLALLPGLVVVFLVHLVAMLLVVVRSLVLAEN